MWYKKLFNLGGFEHEEIGVDSVDLDLPDALSLDEVFLRLKAEAERLHRVGLEERQMERLNHESERLQHRIQEVEAQRESLSKLTDLLSTESSAVIQQLIAVMRSADSERYR
jgi:uncharacterized protein YdcH (DUF465 family)